MDVPPHPAFAKVTLLLDGNYTPIQESALHKEADKKNKAARIANKVNPRRIQDWKKLDPELSKHYSNKYSSISHLVVVALNGRVVYISPGVPAMLSRLDSIKEIFIRIFKSYQSSK